MFSAPILLEDLFLLLWCIILLLGSWWRYARLPHPNKYARNSMITLLVFAPVLFGINLFFEATATDPAKTDPSAPGLLFLILCSQFWISPTRPMKELIQENPAKARRFMLIVFLCVLPFALGAVILVVLFSPRR